jgi:hypothetical protein
MMKKFLFISFLIINVVTSNAQWNGTTAVGNPVCTTSNTTAKAGNVSTTDGAGGMFIAWIDLRTVGTQSIYIQKILSNGSLGFGSEILISNANTAVTNSGNKSNLSIESDGVGGAILTWQDARNITSAPLNNNNDIYGQRVDATGAALWTAGGVRLTVSDYTISNKTAPKLARLNATEGVIIFGDNRLTNVNGYAQKFNLSNGATQWAADVSVHGDQLGTQTNFAIIADGSNGVFITWTDPRASSDRNIYAQRLDNSGAPVIGWAAGGNLVCNALLTQQTSQLVLDGTGGIIIVWGDSRAAAADIDVWANRLDASGNPLWNGLTGKPVCTFSATSDQSLPIIVASGSNFIITWYDLRNTATTNRDIYANSVDINGDTQWPTVNSQVGVPICTFAGSQPFSSFQITSDGSNGAIIVWDDARVAANQDIYAQRINGAGGLVWTTIDGSLISNATGNQAGPVLSKDLTNNTIIAWRDARNGTTSGEIYASKLLLTGVLPLNILQIDASIQNNISTIFWKTDIEINAQKFVVQRNDDGIHFYDVVHINAKGLNNSDYKINDTKIVKTTALYRIKCIDKNGEINFSEVVKVKADNKNLYVNIFPNPVANFVNIEMNNIKAGVYTIKFIDSKGLLAKKQSIKINGSNTILAVDVQNIVAGNYAVQIVGELMNETKMIVIKN